MRAFRQRRQADFVCPARILVRTGAPGRNSSVQLRNNIRRPNSWLHFRAGQLTAREKIDLAASEAAAQAEQRRFEFTQLPRC